MFRICALLTNLERTLYAVACPSLLLLLLVQACAQGRGQWGAELRGHSGHIFVWQTDPSHSMAWLG